MPTYQFEAMDSTGQEIKDVIEATSQEEAQATIRQMGYFITKIAVKKARKAATEKATGGRKRSFAIGGVPSKVLTICVGTISPATMTVTLGRPPHDAARIASRIAPSGPRDRIMASDEPNS